MLSSIWQCRRAEDDPDVRLTEFDRFREEIAKRKNRKESKEKKLLVLNHPVPIQGARPGIANGGQMSRDCHVPVMQAWGGL